MEFNSLFFMMICLPLFILIMRMTANTKAEPYILLCFSLLFYLLSDIRSFLLLAVFILFTWISAQAVHRHSSLYPLYLLITAGLLSIFKYGSFIISHLGAYLHGASAISLIMPVGISFYIFTGISYVSDVYYGKYPPERDLLYLASYLTFFPTIVSGPLHRYEAYRAYLNTHRINCDSIAYGLRRFILGLGKKVILANQLALITSAIFSQKELSLLPAWYGLIAYTLQIYYDFSSYSDMAIGIAAMIGYQLPENFDHPYLAVSFQDFWRRWHITLSRWFRDYVYIPLGGNRVSTLKWLRNMLIVWILTGIWHGSSVNFVLWGLWNFLFLVLERKVYRIKNPVLGWIVTMLIVSGGWLLFRVTSVSQLKMYVRALLGRGIPLNMLYIRSLDILWLIPLVGVSFLLLFVPLIRFPSKQKKQYGLLYDLFLFMILCISVFLIISGSYSAFIYFGF